MLMGLKIFSQNVNGMREFVNRRKIFGYFKQKSADILCLQETHSTLKDEKFWSNEWRGQVIFSHGTNNSRGVAVFFRKDLDYQILRVVKDAQGRFLIISLMVQDRNILLCNLYGPNYDDPSFYATVQTNLKKLNNPEWILTGDFNIVINNSLDNKNSKREHANKKAASFVKQILEDNDLVDVWRLHNDQIR